MISLVNDSSKNSSPPRILISRTDGMGDLCLTLPVFGWIKSVMPQVTTQLLVAPYAESLARKSKYVDEVWVWRDRSPHASESLLRETQADHIIHVFPQKELALAAQRAGIQNRSGVVGRPYHWFTCNRWVFQNRKSSGLHETELNLRIVARALGLNPPSVQEISQMAPQWVGYVPREGAGTREESRPRVLLHPFSFGSGREWPLSYFAEVSHALVAQGWEVWVGGSREEGTKVSPEQRSRFSAHCHWAFGTHDLQGYLELIETMDALVASGTGPLHVAGISGRRAVGIFPPRRSIDASRWAPIGEGVRVLQKELKKTEGPLCKKPCSNTQCHCMADVSPDQVIRAVLS